MVHKLTCKPNIHKTLFYLNKSACKIQFKAFKFMEMILKVIVIYLMEKAGPFGVGKSLGTNHSATGFRKTSPVFYITGLITKKSPDLIKNHPTKNIISAPDSSKNHRNCKKASPD